MDKPVAALNLPPGGFSGVGCVSVVRGRAKKRPWAKQPITEEILESIRSEEYSLTGQSCRVYTFKGWPKDRSAIAGDMIWSETYSVSRTNWSDSSPVTHDPKVRDEIERLAKEYGKLKEPCRFLSNQATPVVSFAAAR